MLRLVVVGRFRVSFAKMRETRLGVWKFYVLELGMRRCNPTSLTFRFLCFIKFQIYLVDMETVKRYSRKKKRTKHRVYKNNNSLYGLPCIVMAKPIKGLWYKPSKKTVGS